MKKMILRGVAAIVALVAFVGTAFVFNEATKEVRILCGTFHEGKSLAQVLRTLDTGNLLKYHVSGSGERQVVQVDSPYNGYTDACTVVLVQDAVVEASYAE